MQRWSPRRARLGRQTSLALQSGVSLGARVGASSGPDDPASPVSKEQNVASPGTVFVSSAGIQDLLVRWPGVIFPDCDRVEILCFDGNGWRPLCIRDVLSIGVCSAPLEIPNTFLLPSHGWTSIFPPPLKAPEAGGPRPPVCCPLGATKHGTKPPVCLSHTTGTPRGCLCSARTQDMQVLVPTGDPVGIPGWDSPLGMPPPPPCPLPAPPWECQHLFIVPKRTLCLLSEEHKKKTFFPLRNGLGCPCSRIPDCAPPSRAGLAVGALFLKEYSQWLLPTAQGRAGTRG